MTVSGSSGRDSLTTPTRATSHQISRRCGHSPTGRSSRWRQAIWLTPAAAGCPSDLLSLDWDRWSEYHGAHEVMNGALAGVLDALGFEVLPFGLGGAWIVTGRQLGWREARR